MQNETTSISSVVRTFHANQHSGTFLQLYFTKSRTQKAEEIQSGHGPLFLGENHISSGGRLPLSICRSSPSACDHSDTLIAALKEAFSWHGTAETVVSNYGPQYNCQLGLERLNKKKAQVMSMSHFLVRLPAFPDVCGDSEKKQFRFESRDLKGHKQIRHWWVHTFPWRE